MEKQIPSPIRAGNITMESKGDFPRGVSPKILFTHIKNTAPFIFSADFLIGKNQRYLTILQQKERWLEKFPDATMDHLTYFELCIAAHWATIGTFVPTDVDNQIRLHLWHPELPLETLFAMTDLVEESLHWDFTPVSTRWVKSPIDHGTLGGHHGEWFSISVAAYGALRPRHPERAKILLEKILLELDRELEVFNHFRQVRDGMGALKAATVIAHNTGPLKTTEILRSENPNPFAITPVCYCPSDPFLTTGENLLLPARFLTHLILQRSLELFLKVGFI